jgi:hypothetical protein
LSPEGSVTGLALTVGARPLRTFALVWSKGSAALSFLNSEYFVIAGVSGIPLSRDLKSFGRGTRPEVLWPEVEAHVLWRRVFEILRPEAAEAS